MEECDLKYLTDDEMATYQRLADKSLWAETIPYQTIARLRQRIAESCPIEA